MRLTKTELKLLKRLLASGRGVCSVEGIREVKAAKSLHLHGLITFHNCSQYIPAGYSNARRHNGDYVGVWSFSGQCTVAIGAEIDKILCTKG